LSFTRECFRSARAEDKNIKGRLNRAVEVSYREGWQSEEFEGWPSAVRVSGWVGEDGKGRRAAGEAEPSAELSCKKIERHRRLYFQDKRITYYYNGQLLNGFFNPSVSRACTYIPHWSVPATLRFPLFVSSFLRSLLFALHPSFFFIRSGAPPVPRRRSLNISL
jgi:hypothetical protein